MQSVHIGLISAMPEEIENFLQHLSNIKTTTYGDLNIYNGFWNLDKEINFGVNISLVWSGWGKVSASRAITRLISHSENKSPIDLILFTGVAGGANSVLKQWDIIIADEIVQYDMDASPLFDKFVIPALNKAFMRPNIDNINLIYSALDKAKAMGQLKGFGNVYKGLIGTGDKFISNKEELKKLSSQFCNLNAVEMEGAAVAQVAEQEGLPWLVIRVISDSADDSASLDFTEFLEIYKNCSYELIEKILSSGLSNLKKTDYKT